MNTYSHCSAFIEFLLQAIEDSLQEAIHTQADSEKTRVETQVEMRVQTPLKTPEQILSLLQLANNIMSISQ